MEHTAESKVSTNYNRPAAEAERLGISVRTLASWMKAGRVPYRKIDRLCLLSPVEVDSALLAYNVGPRVGPKRRAGRIPPA